MSIIGSKITRGGREWQVASTVRAGATIRIVFKAVDDPECRILTQAEEGVVPTRAAELSAALAAPTARWFRDQNGDLWKVEIRGASGKGTLLGGWLVFVPDKGGTRIRLRMEGLSGIGSMTDDQLIKLLFEARRTPA